MSFVSNTLLAFSMSADAFAASVGKGMALRKPGIKDALRIGFIFGVVEMLTPLIGWCAGRLASQAVASVDHWIAFIILVLIGGKMVIEGLKGGHKERKDSHQLKVLILTAIGTSIDAMAVGATLALIGANIILIAFMIGLATFAMTTLGILAGHYIGLRGGRIAEVCGGVCLILVGTTILLEHLGALT